MNETDSSNNRLRRPLFYLLAFFAAYLTYLVLAPFLVPLTWAAVFAVLFDRLQHQLARRIGSNAAALVVTLLTAFVIVGPAVTLASAIAGELPAAASYIQRASLTAPKEIEHLWDLLRERSPFELPEEPGTLLQQAGQRVLAFVAPRAGGFLADLVATLASLLSMLFALFFMLRDGHAISRQLRNWLPLPPEQAERLIHDTRELIVASVGAGVLVALAQGTIGGVAFWLLGFGSPMLWAAATAFGSLMPVFGAALVWVPAALWLMLSGDVSHGVILILVGVFGISMADNILRPLLLSGRTSVSGFVIFFGLLGGAAAFGFIGLVIGPIVLVTTGSLFKLMSQPDLWANHSNAGDPG